MTFQERRLWDFSELVWRWELLIYFENTILRGMWEILLWTSALGLEAFNVMMQRCIFNHCFKLAFSNPVQLPDNNCCFLYWCISLSEVTFFFPLSFLLVPSKYLHLHSKDERENELLHTSTVTGSRLTVNFCPNTWLSIKDDPLLIK